MANLFTVKGKLKYNNVINNVSAATYATGNNDQNTIIVCSNACTITVNNDTMAIGAQIDVVNTSSGTITFAAGSGVTIRSDSSYLNLATQYTAATLILIAAGEWLLIGKLS